jgi:hypothetical protein
VNIKRDTTVTVIIQTTVTVIYKEREIGEFKENERMSEKREK